jgi:hypothetical protein
MDNQTKTIRQWLAGLKNVEHIHDPAKLLDTVCTEASFCCYFPGGDLHTSCGGKALMGFAPCKAAHGVGRGAVYLIFDDQAGELWDVQYQDGKQVHELGSRPFPRLSLVQSA